VEFYLLESYETTGQGLAIDESTVVLESDPLIRYSELTSYDRKNHIFGITQQVVDDVEALEHSVQGLAFAVTANSELVYTGYFWPSYSSMICSWVNIDPILLEWNMEMQVKLEYPGGRGDSTIPDRRNDRRILEIFHRDGKLID